MPAVIRSQLLASCGPFAGRAERNWLCFCWNSCLGKRLLQRQRKHVVHGVHEMQLHRTTQVLGDFCQVLLVVFGEKHLEKSGTMSCEKLFFQTADGEDLAA